MTRNIDHSPFDAALQSDDWLEDARAQEPIIRAAEKPFESQYAEASTDELESRLGEIQKELASLKDEAKLLANIGDKKGARAAEGRVKFLQVEQRVIGKLLRDMEGEVVEVQDDSVEATIAAEARKEALEDPDRQAEAVARAKVRAESLQPERTTARQAHPEGGFFVANSPKKTERAKEAFARQTEALTRQKEATARHEAAVTAVNMLREERTKKWEKYDKEHEVEAFEKSFLDESAYPSETASIRRDLASEKAMSARVKPESFWSRTKRTWFGGTPESTKQSKQESKAFDARVLAHDKERAATAQAREDLSQYRVISARQGGSPTQEPGFFGKLWERFSGQTKREERAAAYRSNIEKIHGRVPEYRAGIGQEALRPKKEQPGTDQERAA